ncbi:unnamed protein product [Adineta ricciae]|uniref:Alpha-mannosidase n=2 Tax=Adineta ricciae TaxID=249248 RepID=A0A813QMH3_ADIRI|nr:unnamed protein product [Adineta ricciae]
MLKYIYVPFVGYANQAKRLIAKKTTRQTSQIQLLMIDYLTRRRFIICATATLFLTVSIVFIARLQSMFIMTKMSSMHSSTPANMSTTDDQQRYPCYLTETVDVVDSCTKCSAFNMRSKAMGCSPTGFRESVFCPQSNIKVYRACPVPIYIQKERFWYFEDLFLLLSLNCDKDCPGTVSFNIILYQSQVVCDFCTMYISFIAFLSFSIALCIAVPIKSSNGCGYAACNLGDPKKLNVHIVAHTHDDVGWLKTVDQYYYGARNNIQHAGVQYVLDSLVHALEDNPDRRFIYVEMAFFWRWWNQQTDEIHDKVKKFVSEGRLEFISGGWCMNDEASTHYNSIIDQHALGAEFLRDQFGECGRPKIGWQIDPFGHSREQASLFAQMGFDGLFFGRSDYEDYNQRNKTKTMEMLWKASANLDRQAWLLTGVLPNQYSPPSSFCFDLFCDDEPIMDDPRLHDYNVPQRVKAFIDTAHNEAYGFATNHIIMTMGSDFQYENANEWFKNMDKLIKYVNAQQANGSDVNVFYSTPSCYLYALNKADRLWTSKTDDFFPYSHHPHGFWTGYFTSRAALKGYERRTNNVLQATRQLNAFANTNLRNKTFPLSEAMGIVQHHDGVSGTEKQHVAEDYAQRLAEGVDAAVDVINAAYIKLLSKNATIPPKAPQFLCQLTNISECLPIEGQDQFTLTLWNPTVHTITRHVRVPVTKKYSVRDATGHAVLADFIPISEPTKKIPGRKSFATNQLVFKVLLPALGFNTYYFEVKTGEIDEQTDVSISENDQCVLENEYLRVEFDNNGNLLKITNLKKNIAVPFTSQGVYWYSSEFNSRMRCITNIDKLGAPGNNSQSEFQASGAYIFRPISSDPQQVSCNRSITCIKGETIQTAVIVFNEWASQEITLYDDSKAVEVQWTVGPIPIADDIGKEIILRYDTDIQSGAKFYTDANGREVLERIRDYRPTWNYTKVEAVSGNYYPVNSRIWIKESNRQLTVLTDRSEGGSSVRDGSLELMVHRRTLFDDALGVGEPLNETAFGQGLVVRGKHFLIVDKPQSSALYHRFQSQNLYMRPLATYALPHLSYADYSATYRQTWSALTKDLPLNIHLLTFDQLDAKQYLIRVEHYFEVNEDDTYSNAVTFDLQQLFQTQGTITDIVELTLAGNLALADMERLEWITKEGESSKMRKPKKISIKDVNIVLNPMQIRTFRVTLA